MGIYTYPLCISKLGSWGLPKSAYATIYVADSQVHRLKSWSILTEFGITMQLQLKSTDAVQNVNPCNQLKSSVKVMELDYQYNVSAMYQSVP